MNDEQKKTISDYGQFDAEAQCFLLTQQPPRKWRNLHYNQPGEHEVYAETSNLGDGPISIRDNDGCKCELVGWDAKYIYIRDDETNTVFNPYGEPVHTEVTDRVCEFYPAQTVICGTAAELRATQRVFVPRTENFEACTVVLENLSDRPRQVSVFYYAKFALNGNNAKGDYVPNDNHTEIHPEINGVFCHNRSRHVPNGRFNAYMVALENYAGANGYRDQFTRSDYSLSAPRILWGWNCDNRGDFGPDCAGIVQVKLSIEPKSVVRADYLIGQASDVEEIQAVLKRTTPAILDEACNEQMQIEKARAEAFTIDTGNPNRDALINIFAKKQMVSYNINKSGFRDNLQNDMGLSMFDYPMARANIIRAIGSQYQSGSVPHGFRPLNPLQYADKPCWMLQCVPALIKESGDFALLDEKAPYLDAPDQLDTIWTHMLKAMRFLAHDTGANGLCDQHFADWNDDLEPSEETGDRESVMVTQQLCLGLVEIEELASRRGENDVAEEARSLHEKFTKILNEVAWDGEWYRRTLCGTGFSIGSRENDQAKILLNTQSWAVLSQTATGERARICMESVDKHLESDIGFRIVDPPFVRFEQRIGKFSALRVGYGLNGGVYCHASGFKGVADCMLGRAEEAWRTYIKTAPDNPENPVGNSLAEPFSFTNCYEAVPYSYGRSQYPWRTGTASWFTILMVEWILGARRHYDGLLIDPCLTKTVPHAKVTRTFRGARYEIELDNSAGRCKGVTSITLDGTPVEGNVLPPGEPGTLYQVKVVI